MKGLYYEHKYYVMVFLYCNKTSNIQSYAPSSFMIHSCFPLFECYFILFIYDYDEYAKLTQQAKKNTIVARANTKKQEWLNINIKDQPARY